MLAIRWYSMVLLMKYVLVLSFTLYQEIKIID